MKVDILSLRDLFSKDVRYLIPPFQRPYVWTKEDQWEQLWDDVCATAERYLEEQQKVGDDPTALEHTRAHFLGAIVIKQRLTSTTEIESRDVIDGQQRLTTMQLLLDATQEALGGIAPQPAKRLSKLVLNDSDLIDGDQDHLFKVWPTSSDRDAFRHAMHNDLPSDDFEESNVVEAHDFFKDQVRDWVKDGPAGQAECALALEATVARLLHLVVIDLGIDDDPHVIFETLNARGTPLLEADLVRNFILSEAGEHRVGADALAHLSKMEGPWWREDVPQGRLVRPRIDVFLNHWIVMRLAEEVPASDVFSTFRKYANGEYKNGEYPNGHSITGITADISEIAAVYQQIHRTGNASALGEFIYRWRGTLAPVLMWLLSAEVPEPQLGHCLRIIESFLARRMICRMTTANYNILFLGMLRRLKGSLLEQADRALVDFLAEQTAWGRLWPDDRQMEHTFVDSLLYRRLTRGGLRLVLENIEEHLRGPLTEEAKVPKNLTIEHVMPQRWRRHWDPPPETDTPEEAERERDRLIHTIGNLTLVNQPLNSTLSNAPWPEKRTTLDKYSVLRLKDSLTGHDEWNEETIRGRSKHLAGIAARVWPHADAWRKRLEA